MLSEAQLRAFHDDGYVTLEGAIAADAVSAMRERLLRRLRHNGVDPDDPTTWPDPPSHLQAVRRGDPPPEASPVVAAALDAVFGAGVWRPPGHWGQALVTFPGPGPWRLPHRIWHLDHGYRLPRDRILGANLFLFVSDVGPRQGGTGAVRGSPRLVADFVGRTDLVGKKMKVLRHQFHAGHPWLRDLVQRDDDDDGRIARFMDADTDVWGVPVRVVELTGRAGDAVLCHPWLVHCGTPNTTDRPRLMRACRVYARSKGALPRS